VGTCQESSRRRGHVSRRLISALLGLLVLFSGVATANTSWSPSGSPAIAAPADSVAGTFPLGVFEDGNMIFGRATDFERLIQDAKAQSLDTVLFNNQSASRDAAMLDVSDRLNFNVYFGPHHELSSQWYGASTPATIEQARSVVYPLVDQVKSHPSVKGYNTADEPQLDALDKVRLATQAFRERDPARASAPVLIGINRGDTIFNAATPDMMISDVYPVGADNPPCNFMMTGFGYPTFTFADYVRRFSASRPPDKPLWVVLQTQNFGSTGLYSLRQPTVPEVRAQHWMALGEGATGIFWYTYSSQQGWTGLKDNPTLFNEIGAQARRTLPLRSTLLGLRRVDDQFITSGAPGSYISTHKTADGSRTYVVVVNAGSCSGPNGVSVLSPTLSGRLKDVETGQLHDLGVPITFQPGDGKLFELVPFPPDAGPTPTPAGLGPNLVKNGTFTTQSSGYPTDWQARPSGSWDGAVGHAAPGALKVTGPASTYSQQSVTLRPGARYLLTYWVKTQNAVGQGVTLRYAQLSPSTSILLVPPKVSGTQDWTSVVTTLTVPSTYAGGRLDILWELTSGAAWIDDIVFAELGGLGAPTATSVAATATSVSATATPAPPTATASPTQPPATATPIPATPTATATATTGAANLVRNGTFTSVSGGFPTDWQARPSGNWDGAVGHAAPGSLKLTGPASIYSLQNVAVQPGATYTLTAWVKTQSVVGRGISLRFPQTAPTTQILTLLPYTSGTQDWTRITSTFSVPASYVGGRLDIIWELTSGTAWVDDVVLTRTP
jgi:hypothetical protein